MEKIKVDGGELEFETKGSGEPLLLIHGSIVAEAFDCLLAEPALTSRFAVTHYHRRGFLGSTPHNGPFTMSQQAADALAVIKQVCGGRAHVAGHSYGAATALRLALDAPQAVHSLALLEPPLAVPSAEAFFAHLGPVNEAYAAGDKAGATRGFLDLVLGKGWEPLVAEHLPSGAFDRAVADIDGFFQVELAALWQLSEEEAKQINAPVLSVVGANSDRFFQEGHELLLRWFPKAESFVVPGATHGLQFMNPNPVAGALAAFFAKHPIPAPARA